MEARLSAPNSLDPDVDLITGLPLRFRDFSVIEDPISCLGAEGPSGVSLGRVKI